MEENTVAANTPDFVETAGADTGSGAGSKAAGEAKPGMTAGAPPARPARRGDLDRPRSYADGFEEADNPSVACGDSSPCTGEPAPAHYDADAVRFAARSARVADEAEALYARWASEAKELAKEYPGFDLAAVAKEPAFARLLRGGADLRSAYEASHMDSVRGAIRAAAAAEAEARVLDAVRLRGLRPDENGARPGGAVLTGGMAGLSRAERARIAERAMRGLL